MNKVSLLLKAQLYNTLSLNEIFSNNEKNKKHTVITVIGIFFLLIFISLYNISTALMLVNIGQQALIPSYMIAISSVIILLLTLLCSNGIFFGTKDFEMLSTLPLSNSEIVSSKFALMYLLSFILCLLFMIPAGIVWICSTTNSAIFFFVYIIGAFFVPLIPICSALLLGILITIVSSHFYNKNIFSLIFSLMFLAALLGIGVYSMKSGIGYESISIVLAKVIIKLYPLSSLFMYQNKFAFIWNIVFYLISLVIFLISIKIASYNYTRINSLMLQNNTNSNTKIELKKHSQIIAMYKKEISRFFSSYLCMLNTGLSAFTLFTISLLLCIVSPDVLGKYLGMENTIDFLGQFAPLIIAAMLSLSCTTSSSISLEGENIWILQSVPLSKKAFINAKILLNLSLHAVPYILSVIIFTLRFELNSMQIATTIVVPVVYSIFISVQGIYCNCKFPKLDWDNEVVVIKQSLSVILSGVIAMISVGIPVILRPLLGISLQATLWSTSLFLICITVILYNKTCNIKII